MAYVNVCTSVLLLLTVMNNNITILQLIIIEMFISVSTSNSTIAVFVYLMADMRNH